MREFRALQETQLMEEEGSEKEVHLIDYEEETMKEADEGDLLVLR